MLIDRNPKQVQAGYVVRFLGPDANAVGPRCRLFDGVAVQYGKVGQFFLQRGQGAFSRLACCDRCNKGFGDSARYVDAKAGIAGMAVLGRVDLHSKHVIVGIMAVGIQVRASGNGRGLVRRQCHCTGLVCHIGHRPDQQVKNLVGVRSVFPAPKRCHHPSSTSAAGPDRPTLAEVPQPTALLAVHRSV